MRIRWRLRNVPVPEGYAAGLAVAFVLHRARRWHLPLARPARRALGWPLTLGGAGLILASFRAAGEVDLEYASRLVTTGPYAYSRNPMYTGWALASLGAGLIADSGWLILAVPAAAWSAHRDVLAEERQLAMSFGDAFNAYRAGVPRYLPPIGISRRRNRPL
jgi:protein-S-isoprenylcysteine O-methyltransferase Ste14